MQIPKKKIENKPVEVANDFKGKTLEQLSIKAENEGVSYGKLVAMKYMGKV